MLAAARENLSPLVLRAALLKGAVMSDPVAVARMSLGDVPPGDAICTVQFLLVTILGCERTELERSSVLGTGSRSFRSGSNVERDDLDGQAKHTTGKCRLRVVSPRGVLLFLFQVSHPDEQR